HVLLALVRSVREQFAALGVEVFELHLAELLMLPEIEVRAVRDTLELSETRMGEWKAVLDVANASPVLGVVGELVLVVLAELQVLAVEAEALPPGEARIAPEAVPLDGFCRMTEELDFHLFEFARPEREVSRGHLVAESLARLGDPERHADPRRVH